MPDETVTLLTVLFYLVWICHDAILDGTLLLYTGKDQAVLNDTSEANCLS